ncbi:OstA-like protein [Cardinium endosymbiont of Culicoides punctatus]|uniref:OstA-like protein n=1 Tax=Cardinium endosymbiont of Culicoides punctatus TaxID=2304601 RepID=UPI001058915F|nr:OstA-like protein [Cardinium endosymbiont of Culicoides punctatus]TDG95743.1 LPS-assembly protein LptD [Cardinium endosymbiont of Culicoides punctatus]
MSKKTIYFIFLSLFLISLHFAVSADEKSVTYTAQSLEADLLNNKPCKRLEGNVRFTFHQTGIVLSADKVYKYDDEDLIEAQGNVQMVDKQGRLIKADRLTYYSETKLATLQDNVMFESENVTCYTQQLVYDMEKKQSSFSNGVKLLQNEMILTSTNGMYNGITHTATFLGEVVLSDPRYVVYSNQLSYHTTTETASFSGPTKITAEQGMLTTAHGGIYQIAKKYLLFNQGTLDIKDLSLFADRLELFDAKDCVATGHVSLRSKVHNMVITGEKATYSAKDKKTEITGQPLLTSTINDELIYLRADTFIVLEKENIKEKHNPIHEIHALNNVRLYQELIQGIADGAVYNSSDNTIRLQNKPVVWCGNYQITGEDVHLAILEDEQVKMFVNKNLFMASADPVGNYNQVKGHKMTADFQKGAIEKMSVEGNGESLYFILAENNELVGMNHMKCNLMEITIKENQLERMEFKPKPNGVFYPAEKIKEEQMKLEDFVWYGEKWPTKENILAMNPLNEI